MCYARFNYDLQIARQAEELAKLVCTLIGKYFLPNLFLMKSIFPITYALKT